MMSYCWENFFDTKTGNYIFWRRLSNNVECCTAVWDSYHICVQRLQAVRVVGLPSLPGLQIFFLMFTIDPVAHCCICEVVCSVYRWYADICVQQTDTWVCSTGQPQIGTTKVWHGSSTGSQSTLTTVKNGSNWTDENILLNVNIKMSFK